MSDDHLNSNRIRQMASLRRGAIRSRSYCVVAAGACAVAAAELVFDAIRRWPAPLDLRGVMIAVLYLICAAALAGAGVYFARLAMRFHREAKQSNLPPAPATPPDFSTLQDGSQMAKNLEELKE